jgi:hypothetical protein
MICDNSAAMGGGKQVKTGCFVQGDFNGLDKHDKSKPLISVEMSSMFWQNYSCMTTRTSITQYISTSPLEQATWTLEHIDFCTNTRTRTCTCMDEIGLCQKKSGHLPTAKSHMYLLVYTNNCF